MQEGQVTSLGGEDSLDEEMATYCSILAWGNPMDRGAWRVTVHGVEKQLKTHFHPSFSLLPFTEPFPASEPLSLTKPIQSICNPYSAPPGLRALSLSL